jgi:hypothetical protein
MIKRIGAAGAATVGVTGIASANRGNIKAIPWEFEDGHTEELSPEAFDAHPETPTVEELREKDGGICCACCPDCLTGVLCYRCPPDCRF